MHGADYRTVEGIVLTTDQNHEFADLEKFGQVLYLPVLYLCVSSQALFNGLEHAMMLTVFPYDVYHFVLTC
jgi:hypothetical protein